MNRDLFTLSPREQAIHALHAATAIYTREPVVDDLLDAVDWPRGKRRLVDPSCGDGVFLGRALVRLLREEPDIDGDTLVDVLQGWELHPGAAQHSRERVAEILEEHGWCATMAAAIAARPSSAAAESRWSSAARHPATCTCSAATCSRWTRARSACASSATPRPGSRASASCVTKSVDF